MRWRQRSSLLSYFTFRIVAPLSVAMIALTVASLLIHQDVVSALLLNRDSEMATLAADYEQHEIREYTEVLQSIARDHLLLASKHNVPQAALRQSVSNPQNLFAGLELLDASGHVIGVGVPASVTQIAKMAVSQGHIPSADNPNPSISDVVLDPNTGANYVIVGVPLFDGAGNYDGALLGSVFMQDALMTELLATMTMGDNGFAYLIDRQGRVLFHHDPRMAGTNLSDLPFVQRVLAGETNGLFWTSPEGEQLIVDFAPVKDTGWGVITQEPWDVAVAPVRWQSVLLLAICAAVILVVLVLLWRGVRRVASPLGWLADQSTRLAEGGTVEPTRTSGIEEIDTLGSAFDTMAAQINAYRVGLRRYAGAITQTLEEERRHIARELHDETVQEMFAIARQIEIYQTDAADPAYKAQLAHLRNLVNDTIHSVRQIIRDLRPRLLEDLGLIPALELLLQATFEGDTPHVTFDVIGQPRPLGTKRELSIYRVVQEAANNARKHAQAKVFTVRLSYEPQRVQLDIYDDGRGFVTPPALTDFVHTGHLGLMGIQERVWSAGGLLTIDSAPGRGVRLHVDLLTPDAAA
jgi:signal transduction histidine kinase